MTRVMFLLAHLHKGGMQRAVSNITYALPREFESSVAFFGTEHTDYDCRGVLYDLGSPGNIRSTLWQRANRLISRLQSIRQLVSTVKPDVIISFGEGAALYNLLSGAPRRILSVRVSLKESLSDTKPLYRWLYSGLVKFTYRFADAIVCNSQQLRNEVEQWCHLQKYDKVRVIPNLFDLAEISRKAQEPLPEPMRNVFQHPVILSVGSLIRQKSQHYLISAFERVHAKFPDVRLVLVGRGDDEAQLREQCADLKLSDYVVFAGYQTNPYAFMARCRLFVLPSLYEGLPNALIEAMACGAPVISADCPTGPREILAPGTPLESRLEDQIEVGQFGTLVPTCDVSTALQLKERAAILAEAIHSYLADPERSASFSRLSMERAADFSADRISQRWADLLSIQGDP